MRLRRGPGDPCRRCSVIRFFDPWGSPLCTCPPKYSLQPYTGCSHMCLYCYATAYIGVRPSTPKKRFIERLRRDLRYVDPRLVINMSTSSDPYPPEEERYGLTRKALRLLLPAGFRVLITTKGALVSRDSDLLSAGKAAVTITITTLDPGLASRLEPGAPTPRSRLEALERLASLGVPVGVRVDPVIPGLNDDPDELRRLVEEAVARGARLITTSTFKARPDSLARMRRAFPDMAERWNKMYREEGVWMHGYWYLPAPARRRLLRPVVEEARRLGAEYATCREGLTGPDFFRSGSCDGSHLVPR